MAQKRSERPLWFCPFVAFLVPIAVCALIGGGGFMLSFYSSDRGLEKKKDTVINPKLDPKAEHITPSPRTVAKTKPRTEALAPPKKWDDIEREELAAEIEEAGKRFRRERIALEERQRKEREAWERGEIPSDEEIRERLIRAREQNRIARRRLEESKRMLEEQRYWTKLYASPK